MGILTQGEAIDVSRSRSSERESAYDIEQQERPYFMQQEGHGWLPQRETSEHMKLFFPNAVLRVPFSHYSIEVQCTVCE